MEKQWYVFKTYQHNIPKVKEILAALEIECFVPFRKEKIEKNNGIFIERLCPLVLNYFFIKCSIDKFRYNIFPFSVYPCYDSATSAYMIIKDKTMADFMFMHDFSANAMILSNENLKHGDHVRILKGQFAGIEGELIRIKGHKRVVVRLEGLFSLAVDTYLPKSFLEKLDK